MKVHGEAYGGKQQKMADTYGPKTKFVVFDVYVEDETKKYFLNLTEAEAVAAQLGLEFVHYIKSVNTPEAIENETIRESIQAVRNGIGPDKLREGTIIKPLIESYIPSYVEIKPGNLQDTKRAIFKYKNKDFWEIKSRRPLGEELKLVSDIDTIVSDWVTDNRFQHVLDRTIKNKKNKFIEFKDVGLFLQLMVEDVNREAVGEIVWSKHLEKCIRRKTAIMFKKYLASQSS